MIEQAKRKKILIVEDEIEVGRSILDLLEYWKYDAVWAKNGKEALPQAIKFSPDLIISDIMMPEMDGLELLESLKSMGETSTIPFILLSAKSDKDDVRKGMQLGADDYISKPFNNIDLKNTVATQLKKFDTRQKKHQDELRKLKLSLSVALPHELRTPLNSIYSASQFLDINAENLELEDRKDLYGTIATSSLRLKRLIQNYLLYTELEIYNTDRDKYKNIPIEQCSLEIEDVVNHAIEFMRDFEGYEKRIEVLLPEDLSFALKIRPDHLQKVLEEILSNAMKFHLNDNLSVSLEIKHNRDKGNCSISIYNPSVPLSEEELDSINAYIQFSREKKEQQGLGLGLYLVKSITDLYGGVFRISPSESGNITKLIFNTYEFSDT
ncbi:MAG: response regulator [Candidatus Kapaibacteriales bacterium]